GHCLFFLTNTRCLCQPRASFQHQHFVLVAAASCDSVLFPSFRPSHCVPDPLHLGETSSMRNLAICSPGQGEIRPVVIAGACLKTWNKRGVSSASMPP